LLNIVNFVYPVWYTHVVSVLKRAKRFVEERTCRFYFFGERVSKGKAHLPPNLAHRVSCDSAPEGLGH